MGNYTSNPKLRQGVMTPKVEDRDFLQRTGPPTEHLLLLDAQEALDSFRYREAVLLSWGAIETSLAPFLRGKLLEKLPSLSFDRDSAGANIEQDLHFLTHAGAA